MSCFRVFGFGCFLCLTFKRTVRLKIYCFSFISFFHQNVCRAANRFLPFISFCLVLFGLLLLASQGLKLFGSCWFSFFFLFIRLQCCLLSTSAYGTCAACWLWTVLSRSVKQAWGCLSLILTFLPLLVLLVEQSLLFYLGLQTDFYFLMSSFGLFIVIGFAWLGIIWLMLTFSSFVLFISFQSCLWSSSAYESCSVVGFSMPFQAQGRKFEGA